MSKEPEKNDVWRLNRTYETAKREGEEIVEAIQQRKKITAEFLSKNVYPNDLERTAEIFNDYFDTLLAEKREEAENLKYKDEWKEGEGGSVNSYEFNRGVDAVIKILS